MSHPLMLRRGLLEVSTAAVMLGLALASAAQAQCVHPETPCPCCADGMCYPKRDTWGNYTTNWRPWPGQPIKIAPTPAAEVLEGVREQLPPFVRPRPDQEDLRGPARPVRPAAPAAQPGTSGAQPGVDEQAPVGGQPPLNGQPAAGEQQAPALDEVPAPEEGLDLPGFGPQGALQPLPRIEEGPPSLPRSLTHALISQSQAQTESQGGTNSPQTTATVKANGSSATSARTTIGSAISTGSPYVTPTAGTSGIDLTNPAARHVQKTMDQDLHHAIYYEASAEAASGGR